MIERSLEKNVGKESLARLVAAAASVNSLLKGHGCRVQEVGGAKNVREIGRRRDRNTV